MPDAGDQPDRPGLDGWLRALLADPEMLRMGHGQRAEDLNLGLGWVYYGLARALRPRVAVVIGSYRGFVPAVVGRGLLDNAEGGEVHFIDPSLVDDFWRDPEAVRGHFRRLGAPNVRHHLATTQAFIETEAYRAMGEVGLLFIDGYHSAEQVRFDLGAFRGRLAPGALTLMHDSLRVRPSRIYGEPYTHEVRTVVDELRQDPGLDVINLPIAEGVAIVRERAPEEVGA